MNKKFNKKFDKQ